MQFFYFGENIKVEQAEKVFCFIIDFKFSSSQLMHRIFFLLHDFFLSYVLLCKNL